MSAVSSGIFSLVNQFISISITFGSLAILGRLLTPEDFGLFGIILAVQTLFLPLLTLGLKPAFIKLPSVDEQVSNAFFTLNFSLGIIIAIFLIGSAPILMYIYEKPALLPLTLVFALSVVIQSLIQQPIAVLSRAKLFEKTMAVDICGLLCGTSIAIGSAFCGLGAWALVFRAIAYGVGRYLTTKWFLRQRFHLVGLDTIKQYMENISFGVEIVISRLIGGLANSVDKLIFGKYFSVDLLGQYTRAFKLSFMPDSNIRMSLSTPALAHLARSARKNYQYNYLIMCNVILLIAGLPCMIFIVLGDWILPWFMGSQWIQAGVYLQILGLWGLGKVFHGISLILHLNEMRTRKWILVNCLGLPMVFTMPLILTWKGFGPFYFIVSLSVGCLVFWGVVLMTSLYIFTESLIIPSKIVWSLLLTSTVALITGFAIKYELSLLIDSNYIGMGLSIFLSSIIILLCVTLAQSTLNRHQTLEIYSFIRKRYVSK